MNLNCNYNKWILGFLLTVTLMTLLGTGVLAYWDNPPNGLNLTCEICEYKSDKCDATEEEVCSSPVSPCHNSKEIYRVVQSLQAKLHALLKPQSPSARSKYICIKIEDESEKFDYIPDLPISRGRGAGRIGGFVGEFGEQSPQFIKVVGRPNMNNPGIPAAIERGMASENLILDRKDGPLTDTDTGAGSGSGNPIVMSPYASAAVRARIQMVHTQNQLPAPPAACDESTINIEACNPPDGNSDAGDAAAAGESDASTGACVHQEQKEKRVRVLISGGGLLILLISVYLP